MNAKLQATGILMVLALLALSTCTIPAQAGRYTYIVKYSVSYTESALPGTPISPTIMLRDSSGLVPPALPVTSAWSEEFSFSYSANGYDNPFTPELAVSIVPPLDETGDSITITVSWKDYRTNFEEVVLERYTAAYVSADVPVNETLFGPSLPE